MYLKLPSIFTKPPFTKEISVSGDPWIGRCTGANYTDRTLSLQWMKGVLNKAWAIDKRYQVETVSFESILMWGFNLTDQGYLRESDKSLLKEDLLKP